MFMFDENFGHVSHFFFFVVAQEVISKKIIINKR